MPVSLATVAALGVFAAAWTILAALSRHDLRVASVALMVLAPVAVALWLPAPTKMVTAAAGVAAGGGLLVGMIRSRRSLGLGQALRGHPLLAFVLLYAACALYGLLWALWRGNDVALMLGQEWTALLFLAGFTLAGPLVASRATDRHWLAFIGAVALLCLPALAPLATWVGSSEQAGLVRFLQPAAFYAPVCTLLALSVVLPGRRRAGAALAALLMLVTLLTFTRSYWLGLAVGLLVLIALAVVRARARGIPRPRLPRRSELAGIAVAGSLAVALVAGTPVAEFALERGAQTRQDSGDLSVEVRTLELKGALKQVAATPVSGVGSGGKYVALRQLDSERVFYGPTNFVHNAYLYFPLKFGALGFGALVALLGGALTLLGQAARRVRVHGVRAAAFPSAALALLALSLTAPNLVDPTYSLFAGVLLFLAGTPKPLARAEEDPCAT